MISGAVWQLGDTWHLDELFVTIQGQRRYLWRAVDQDGVSSLECPGVLGAELLTPLSDGFVGDYDPALCQKVFNISEAQAESTIERDGMADDIRRESVSLIGWCVGVHWPSVPAVAST